MKLCEENIQDKTVSDEQTESSHVVLVTLLFYSP